ASSEDVDLRAIDSNRWIGRVKALTCREFGPGRRPPGLGIAPGVAGAVNSCRDGITLSPVGREAVSAVDRPEARSWPVWVGLALYTALRLALLPSDGAVVGGYGHDSGYITIVADNLLAGRGYVNDAHWLVFLHPDALPMPYHTANPLYPTVVAAVAWLTGRGTVWAGFAVAAVSSSLLFAGLYVIAGRYTARPWQRVALAAAGTFFPAVFEDSLHLLPDALFPPPPLAAAPRPVPAPRLPPA